MPPLRAVLFDAGSTLVFPNREEILRVLARHGCVSDPVRLESAELDVRRRLDTPEWIRRTNDASRWDDYFGGILDRLGAPRSVLADLRAYHDRRNLWDWVPPEIPPVLERLRARYRLAVISNSNGTVASVLDRLGIGRHFELVVDSHVVGIEKPDPRIFRLALDRLALRADEGIYVGDIYHVDVVGARGAGLDAVLLDPGGIHADKDCRRVRSLGELERLLAEPPADCRWPSSRLL